MGPLFPDSSPLRGWILSVLFALLSCAAPLGASDASPANRLPSVGVRADAPLGAQDSSLGAQAPTPDLSPGEPGRGATPFPLTGHLQFGPQRGEREKLPVALENKQRADMLKSDFEKMKRDAAELATLAQSLQEDLGKSDERILSLKIIDKAQKIERLAKRISRTAKSY